MDFHLDSLGLYLDGFLSMFSAATPRGMATSERWSDARLVYFTAYLLINFHTETDHLI